MNDLNIEEHDALVAHLHEMGLIGRGEDPRTCILEGGVSNRTVLVERSADVAESWVIKQALPKLRVEVDWFCDPMRIHREALGLRRLAEITPAGSVPAFVAEDVDNHLLVMQAVPQPHDNWKAMLLGGQVDLRHVEQFARILSSIHAAGYERRDELRPLFEDRSYFEALRLEPYYAFTAGEVPESSGFLESLIKETSARRLALVHGDYSPKNILVHENRLILLDHEVIHWGDPAFDIGFALTHLLSKARHLAQQRAVFADAANRFWDTYNRAISKAPWSNKLERFCVFHTLGCLLARVAGRSPLEYLSEEERKTQKHSAVTLMRSPPPAVPELIDRFCRGV